MVKVTAAEVNKLRKTTGAGMMDCKKALVEADGNFDSAIEILRKKGQKVAAKRADRESSEGVAIAIANEDNTSGVGIVLACETDFVGKNADFIDLAHKIAANGLKCNSKEDLLKSNLGDMSVEEKLIEQTGVIGEKVQINDFTKIDAAFVGTYIHAGNKISSLVGFSEKCENIEIAAKDISMQIAAMNPIALDEDSVDSEVVEKEIYDVDELPEAPEGWEGPFEMKYLYRHLKCFQEYEFFCPKIGLLNSPSRILTPHMNVPIKNLH